METFKVGMISLQNNYQGGFLAPEGMLLFTDLVMLNFRANCSCKTYYRKTRIFNTNSRIFNTAKFQAIWSCNFKTIGYIERHNKSKMLPLVGAIWKKYHWEKILQP